jgi:triosephosphate isomerase
MHAFNISFSVLQFVTPENDGAFTGGVSASMLKSLGIEWALAGHSERRTINQESNEEINRQCLKLIENDMNVVLCIGETLAEYEMELVGAVCEIQLKKNLAGVSAEDMKKVTIAYEVRKKTETKQKLTGNILPVSVM